MTDRWTSAPGSFLFSLRNNDDLGPFKAPLRNESHGGAIHRGSRFGPIFGRGVDLLIDGETGSYTGYYTDFGYSYQLPPGYIYGETNTKSLLAGSYEFSPSEIEILYLN